MSERQQRATDSMTTAPRWKHLWCQHGIIGGTLAHILAHIWFADLLTDSERYSRHRLLQQWYYNND